MLSPARIEQLFKRSPRQKAIYDLLLKGELGIPELSKAIPTYSAPLKKLRDKKLVEVLLVKNHRQPKPAAGDPGWGLETPLEFSEEQKKCYSQLAKAIDEEQFSTFLLHGVTGSGKTEIYLRCIQRVLDLRKTAIMVVPEISLTPQTVGRFRMRFGNHVAILHSGLSQRDRYLEWKKVQDGLVSIVVGARSAIFAPFTNIGIIVIDEEHDTSYKQDSNPRYHARDTAIVRARGQNAVVILGSATPSLESLHNCRIDKYRYLALEKRVPGRLMPTVKIVDMRKEMAKKKNFSILSTDLKSGIRERLKRGEQTFLFLNRRGTANYVFCRECGFVFPCVRCSVTLTFHGNEKSMRCHYCNYQIRIPSRCADCSGEVLRFSGFGTQKLEAEIRRLYPDANIIRIDRDTTRGQSAFETMHRQLSSGKVDVLIGTQMITKGHDFPNVTLVGVIYADLSLNIPDFRSGERSFQLLTQVSGRAGRGKVPGQVIIQTCNPNHYVFDFVKEHPGPVDQAHPGGIDDLTRVVAALGGADEARGLDGVRRFGCGHDPITPVSRKRSRSSSL